MSLAFTVRPTTKLIRACYLLAVLMAIGVLVVGRRYDLAAETQYALLALPAILLAGALWRHFSRRFVKLTVADGRLRYQSGILNRTIRTLELSRIQDVRCDQTITERLLGIGDITIETAGEFGRLHVEDIDAPQRVAEQILDLSRGGAKPAAAS
ncbi:MAG: PH domain-containing protein [Bryobacteraceae bacterium]|nr:PH domain-containing protein [Bryobacteraceae bacterium]